jgi:hypothetical protein
MSAGMGLLRRCNKHQYRALPPAVPSRRLAAHVWKQVTRASLTRRLSLPNIGFVRTAETQGQAASAASVEHDPKLPFLDQRSPKADVNSTPLDGHKRLGRCIPTIFVGLHCPRGRRPREPGSTSGPALSRCRGIGAHSTKTDNEMVCMKQLAGARR